MCKFAPISTLLTVILLFVSAVPAHGAPSLYGNSIFVLEPYVGYERGYLTGKGAPEITTMGIGYGARIGARLTGIGIGIDYYTGSQSASQVTGQNSDFKPTEFGPFVSFRFWESFNVYGTYLIDAKTKVQSNTNLFDFSGSGYKLGLGWSALAYLDINLEIINRKYTKYGGTSLANPLVSSTLSSSLSFPIF